MEEIDAMKGFELDGVEYGTVTSLFRMPVGPTKEKPLLAKPNAMAFFHIPLAESYEALVDGDRSSKSALLKVGERLEGNGASKSP